jgi:hydroxymethylpyrimidine/phosphomethylpyrimidine kinase
MVCGVLETARVGRGERLPLIVDPVMVATSGDPLIRNEAVAAYCERLIPMATLITPNLDEVATLLGRRVGTVEEMRQAGLELHERFGCSVLVKGGHLRGSAAVDVLVEADRLEEFTAPFVPGVSTHGTGCTYSAAIATELALGRNLVDAVRTAKGFVTMAINRIQRWPRDNGPTDALDHFGDRR